jgi:alpha-glucosidase
MLGFASIFQIPVVGSDIWCVIYLLLMAFANASSSGFGADTTETLCARWAMLGAFNPFYRNHNGDTSIPQEFYRWPLVAEAARNAISMRYRLLDYFYTALHRQHTDGTPALQPLWFQYPQDANTFGIDTQFLFGDSIMVAPVLQEDVTTVDVYMPDDAWYNFLTHEPVTGLGATVALGDVSYTEIPVYIKGGAVLPLRVHSENTTTDLRNVDFELVVAPSTNGTATGTLYLDDGVSIQQSATFTATYQYDNKQLNVQKEGFFDVGSLKYKDVKILGVQNRPSSVVLDGHSVDSGSVSYNATAKSVTVTVGLPLSSTFTLSWQ